MKTRDHNNIGWWVGFLPERRCAPWQKNRRKYICRRQIPLYKCRQIDIPRLLNGITTTSQRHLHDFKMTSKHIVNGWSTVGFRFGINSSVLRVCACVGEMNVCFCLCFRGFWYVTNGNSTAVLLYRLLHQNLSITLSVIFNIFLTSPQTTS